jgi:hypothetical protein
MVRATRFVYLVLAWLFVGGVAVQVFLAGMVVVAARMNWEEHIVLGHSLAGPLLFMLVTMHLGRLPGPVKRLTWLLFGAYILQADVVIFLRANAPVISAFHPVFALVDFALGLTLALRASAIVRQEGAASVVRPAVKTAG